ncbi:unnamed protein product [Chrysoparadoxa australica]
MKIGVLALQGAFEEHAAVLKKLGAEVTEIRLPSHFEGLDGIILPGGESTAMALIGERWGVFPSLKQWVADGRPVWGTCAGMILLSSKALMTKQGGQSLVGGMDVEVCRNYFGSQISSFEQNLDMSGICPKDLQPYPAVFIRAPAILWVEDPCIEVLAAVRAKPCSKAVRQMKEVTDPVMAEKLKTFIDRADEKSDPEVVVAARKGSILATAFHPELTNDIRWHRYFLTMVESFLSNKLAV